jgi:hypothetical protein
VRVRRPSLDYESPATALNRNEPGTLLVAAGLGPPAGHALTSLPALNGLRLSEATGANIEHLGLERRHRTLVTTRKTPQGFDLSNRVHPGLFAMMSCQGTLTLPAGHVPDGLAIRGRGSLSRGHAAASASGVPAR